MRIFLNIWFLICLIITSHISLGQKSDSTFIKDSINKVNQTTVIPNNSVTIKKPRLNPNAETFHTPDELRLTLYFLFFGAFVLIIAAILLYKFSTDSNTTFKYFIIILLILGMLLLIAIGLDKDQISPAVGLFGTIAGYLLGKTDLAGSVAQKKGDS